MPLKGRFLPWREASRRGRSGVVWGRGPCGCPSCLVESGPFHPPRAATRAPHNPPDCVPASTPLPPLREVASLLPKNLPLRAAPCQAVHLGVYPNRRHVRAHLGDRAREVRPHNRREAQVDRLGVAPFAEADIGRVDSRRPHRRAKLFYTLRYWPILQIYPYIGKQGPTYASKWKRHNLLHRGL